MIEGGCFCGFVRYQALGPTSNETNCHCSICRRVSGASFVTWFSVPRGTFVFVSGEPATFRSSVHATRSFCPRCGTPLTFESSHSPDEIDVTTCSLDAPETIPPNDHIHVSAKLSFVKLDDGLPVFPEERR